MARQYKLYHPSPNITETVHSSLEGLRVNAIIRDVPVLFIGMQYVRKNCH